MATGSFSFVIFLIVLLKVIMGYYSREILVDEETPRVKGNTLRVDGDGEVVEEVIPCHMEYQVMKRVVGSCIKLGRSSRGCVAGNYLHPLHPDCI